VEETFTKSTKRQHIYVYNQKTNKERLGLGQLGFKKQGKGIWFYSHNHLARNFLWSTKVTRG
jgi:hypothetical protein